MKPILVSKWAKNVAMCFINVSGPSKRCGPLKMELGCEAHLVKPRLLRFSTFFADSKKSSGTLETAHGCEVNLFIPKMLHLAKIMYGVLKMAQDL